MENLQPKKRRKSRSRKIKRHIVLKILLFILILFGTGCCFVGIKVNDYFEEKTGLTIRECYDYGKESVKESKREDFKSDKATNIYASDDSKIATIYKNKENTYLTYDEIPINVVNAFIAVEDRSFWENDGIDIKGIIRVLYNFVKTSGAEEHGASTITQQLARQKYLTLDRTLSRKVAEIAAAQELTKMYSKEDIMEFYVNMCCYANGIYGIQDASLTYFGKDAKDLTLSQTAYLCAIPNWPEHYNPKKNPETAITRRDKILKDMLELGFISEPQYNKAVDEEIVIYEDNSEEKYYDFATTYAIHCATKYIMELQGFEFQYVWNSDTDYKNYQKQYNEAYEDARNEVYKGGYDIYTTLDLEQQDIMQKALDESLVEETEVLENGLYKLQAAMTVIDNENGKVIAIIGGRTQDNTQLFAFNRGYQGYSQPGSTIKPIAVYAPSMEVGDGDGEYNSYTPNSILYNINVDEAKKSIGKEISVMDGNPIYMRSAVENSLNGCAYWLMNDIGVKRGLKHLTDMGFSRIIPSDYTLSASLGGLTYGVSTEEMANAYYTLENDGIFKDTTCIKSILDVNGEEIYQEKEGYRVYEKDAANAMTDVLKGVLTVGTAKGSQWYNNTNIEAAGKTGTTNDNKDAWFCGYTPYYTIAVHVGCDTPEEIKGLVGSNYPLDIWKSAMLSLIADKPEAKLAEMPEMKESKSQCICSIKCLVDSIEENCPVCSRMHTQESLDMVCVGTELECNCITKCEGDEINELCPSCVVNHNRCLGVNETTECICTSHCEEGTVNIECPRCRRNWTICGSQTLECICETNCSQNGLNGSCQKCLLDINSCRIPPVEENTPQPIEETQPQETQPPTEEIGPGITNEPIESTQPQLETNIGKN